MCLVNQSPQGTNHSYLRIPLTVIIRTHFTKESDDSDDDVSELSRLLGYRLMVLEAALQRVNELRNIAATAPTPKTTESATLLHRVSEILHRHGWE